MRTPIVDSLAHPTLTGTWMARPADAHFAALIADMKAAGVEGACAIGMWGMDGYQHEAFIAACKVHPELVPIAGYKPLDPAAIDAEVKEIGKLGYRGIKLHPRFSELDVSSPEIAAVLRAAHAHGLVVFYCTYMHCSVEKWPDADPFLALVRTLKLAPEARVVLVHGGDVELLRYMQLVRFNDNLLLDLSHTILKYPGSSIDLDIRFLFQHFDRRICIGSDWPQFSCGMLRERFEYFANGLEAGRKANIASRNLLRFLGNA
jgi:predicted TIM-barrel fold metal-dependent hydrolase